MYLECTWSLTIWATSWQNQQCGCAPSEDSDQPGHPPSLIRVLQPGQPPSLIRVFAVRMKKGWILSYPLNAQRRLWSDWADAQADLSLRWAHSHFVGFVMRRLIYWTIYMNKNALAEPQLSRSKRKPVMPYANNKDADQPVHPRRFSHDECAWAFAVRLCDKDLLFTCSHVMNMLEWTIRTEINA